MGVLIFFNIFDLSMLFNPAELYKHSLLFIGLVKSLIYNITDKIFNFPIDLPTKTPKAKIHIEDSVTVAASPSNPTPKPEKVKWDFDPNNPRSYTPYKSTAKSTPPSFQEVWDTWYTGKDEPKTFWDNYGNYIIAGVVIAGVVTVTLTLVGGYLHGMDLMVALPQLIPLTQAVEV